MIAQRGATSPIPSVKDFSTADPMKTMTHFSSVALFALAIAGCGGGGGSNVTGPPGPPGGGTTGPTASVTALTVSNNKYTPSRDSVAVGAALTWGWNSCSTDIYGQNTCVSHSVTFDDGPTSPIQSSGTFSRTFAAAGSYPYHCMVHGAAMSGTVLVQ